MIQIDSEVEPGDLLPELARMWAASADRLDRIEQRWENGGSSPVYTVDGKYQAQGWTEWTQGFQYGSPLLQFDATDEPRFLDLGREQTLRFMAGHVTHTGVHDHGFNNVSTYGALLRLMNEGRILKNDWELLCREPHGLSHFQMPETGMHSRHVN